MQQLSATARHSMLSSSPFTGPVFADQTRLTLLECIIINIMEDFDDGTGTFSTFSPAKHYATMTKGNWVILNGR